MSYECALSLELTSASVGEIREAGQSITITSRVSAIVEGDARRAAAARVAWLVFSPFEHNVVRWRTEYSLYATESSATSGTSISILSQTAGSAAEGVEYSFQDGGFHPSLRSRVQEGSFIVQNLTPSPGNELGFGLTQDASLNGNPTRMAPMGITTVLRNEVAAFTPHSTVEVFLSSLDTSGTVLPDLSVPTCTVAFGADTRTATLGFDQATSTFYVKASQGADS